MVKLHEYGSIDDNRYKDEFSANQNGKTIRLCQKIFPTGFKSEAKSLIILAIPAIITNLTLYTILTESLIVCGHLQDKYKLDGAALAISIISALGICIGEGLTTACDTYFSQVFGSVSQRKHMGVILQRGLMISTLAPLILWVIHINMEPFFVLMGQDLRVAELAARYIIFFSPGLMFAFQFMVLTRYLQNQDRLYAPMIIGGCGNVFNIISQYVTVQYFDLGIEASAVCMACTYLLMESLLIMYIIVSKVYVETWDGWSREAFVDWGPHVYLAITGVGIIGLEACCWEFSIFIAGIMGPVELGVQTVLFQVVSTLFQITFGISIAVNIRVGQSLGANNPKKALTSYRVGLFLIFVLMTFIGFVGLALKDYIPMILTDDKEIISEASRIFILIMISMVLDSLNCVNSGALRGCGRQTIGVISIFFAYYILGEPIGISMAFLANLGVAGLWLGLNISLFIMVTALIVFLNLQNWKKQADKAQIRIGLGGFNDESTKQLISENNFLLDASFDDTPSHKRSPSQGSIFLDNAEILPRRRFITEEEYSRAILSRIGILIILLVFFSLGIILHCTLPRSVYMPNNSTNIVNETYFN